MSSFSKKSIRRSMFNTRSLKINNKRSSNKSNKDISDNVCLEPESTFMITDENVNMMNEFECCRNIRPDELTQDDIDKLYVQDEDSHLAIGSIEKVPGMEIPLRNRVSNRIQCFN